MFINFSVIRVNNKLELELNLNLRDQLLAQQEFLLQAGKQRAGPLGLAVRFLSNSQLVRLQSRLQMNRQDKRPDVEKCLLSCLGSTPSKSTNQRAAFLQPATSFLLRDKLITQGEKRETSTQNLQQNNVARQVKPAFVSPISSAT